MVTTDGRSRRPTQSDIARLAGVSRTAVSLVLSGNTSKIALSDDTHAKVESAARQLGYVRDPVATKLAAGRNNLLGIYTFSSIFPTEIGNSYYGFLTGIEEESAEIGYDVVLFTASSTPSFDRSAGELRRVRLADGVILLGRHLPAAEVSELLDDDFPLVYIGRQDALGSRLPYVGIDYETASRDVVDRLIEFGHRRLLYLREDDDAPSSTDRQEGFLRGVGGGLHRGVRGHVLRTAGTTRVTADSLRSWLTQGFTAIVIEQEGANQALVQLTDAMDVLGLSAPEDLSIAVLGDPTGLPAGQPEFAGFAYPREEAGRLAVRLLRRLLAGEDVPSAERQALVPCVPITGTTAGPLAVR
ncbi:MAG: LacI family DNA-binding transcriptional regulator [Microbacterium sp.]|uniref:LacI family DNA-binding transcriptional regulator n=1 Tax=Microbacterium sp. TaxID=51671 RepID=UPI0039E4A81B